MDNEIRIKPTVDLGEIQTFERHLTAIEQHMQRISGAAAKIHLPGGGSPAEGTSGAGSMASSGPSRQTVSHSATATDRPVAGRMPRGRTRTAGSQQINSGQFLTDFQSIIEPILPQLDAMMQQTGSTPSKGRAHQAIHQHLQHIQQIAAHPADSTAESHAILAANQATGLDPQALRHAAQQYRTTPPNTTQATNAYWQAFQHTQKGAARGSGQSPSVLQQMAGATGFGKLGELLGGGAALGVGSAALGAGFVANQTRKGWQTYSTQAVPFSALAKSMGTLGESFNTLRNTVNQTGLNFAESLPQITQVVQTLAPLTGNLGTRGLQQMTSASQGFAFGYGLSPTHTAQAFGQASQMGILGTNSSRGQMTPAQWAATIANAVSAGGMQGRQGQVLSSMLSVNQQIAQQIAHAPNQALLSSMMTSLNQSGNPLLQGTNGAQVLSTMNQGIVHPGLGSAGALASYQQLNPNGKLGYFQTKYLQSQGLNGTNPTTGQSNLAATMQYYRKMLPQGRVTMHHGMPTEQTAAVATMMGGQLGLTAGQSVHVLQAFQNHPLSQVNATQALASKLGSHTLSQVLQHGGLNAFAGIANATGVGGTHGLNAYAKQITHTLHGHVSTQYYQLAHQYQQLGHQVAHSPQQAHALQHQRAVDLTHMKQILGGNVAHGPTLGTSMDHLTTTMQKANAEWAKIAKQLTPIVHELAKMNNAVAHGVHQTMKNPLKQLIGPALGLGVGGTNFGSLFTGKTSSYALPGLQSGSPTATLASFVQGNQQTTFLQSLQKMMGGGSASSSGGSGPYQTASWTRNASGSAAGQTGFVKNMLPVAQSVSKQTGLPSSFLLAQYATETGWGQHMTGANNFGNIKNPQTGKFQAYASPLAFAKADAAFYNNNSRYQPLLHAAKAGASGNTLTQLLGQSGYATNPQYGSEMQAMLGQIHQLLAKVETNTRQTSYASLFGGAQGA